MTSNELTKDAQERQRQVDQANANQSIESQLPDSSDKRIQDQFVAGTASVEDLLKHANDFVLEVTGKKQ
jgi:dephospho-CoA kinase